MQTTGKMEKLPLIQQEIKDVSVCYDVIIMS